jgi:hypothetical protein
MPETVLFLILGGKSVCVLIFEETENSIFIKNQNTWLTVDINSNVHELNFHNDNGMFSSQDAYWSYH